MRQLLLVTGLLVCPVVAFAQDDAPRPFVVGGLAFATENEPGGLGTRVGFDTTIGLHSWQRVQLFGQGGRLIDVTPTPLLPDPERLVRFQPDRARHTATWYGGAGARYFLPSLWRLHPYAETSAGVARMSSDMQPLESTGASTDDVFRVNNTVPLAGLAGGVQLHVGRRFTVDAGYRAQRFFGEADTTRKQPYVAFGVRF
jgi:opacity protein-like surface antigen